VPKKSSGALMPWQQFRNGSLHYTNPAAFTAFHPYRTVAAAHSIGAPRSVMQDQ
jgi:hypothetical protein